MLRWAAARREGARHHGIERDDFLPGEHHRAGRAFTTFSGGDGAEIERIGGNLVPVPGDCRAAGRVAIAGRDFREVCLDAIRGDGGWRIDQHDLERIAAQVVDLLVHVFGEGVEFVVGSHVIKRLRPGVNRAAARPEIALPGSASVSGRNNGLSAVRPN